MCPGDTAVIERVVNASCTEMRRREILELLLRLFRFGRVELISQAGSVVRYDIHGQLVPSRPLEEQIDARVLARLLALLDSTT